jgi:PII-like signaling protein
MSVEGKAKILRIFLNEKTKHNSDLLYDVIVQTAFKKGVSGSMVFRGLEGFGFCCEKCRTVHEGLTISDKCQPMVIEFIDTEEKFKELVPILKGMLKRGAMIMQDADILFNQG